MSTASLHGARDHARAQAGATATTQRTLPASSAVDLPSGVAAADVVWDETIAAGNYASHELPRGTVLRIADADGDASVHLIVHNAGRSAERLSVADTVKVQWQAYLGPGAVLLSDMGRALMTLVADSSARHDALCGAIERADRRDEVRRIRRPLVDAHGTRTADRRRRQAWAHGRDLPAGVNLFKSALVDDDGALQFAGSPRPGAAVELRADLDVIVMIANVPHPLDERPAYTSSTVRLTAWSTTHPGPMTRCGASTPERRRAYENTDDFLAGVTR